MLRQPKNNQSSGPLPVDGAELARYRNHPGGAEAETRFAQHVLSRYPDNVTALTILSKHASSDREFERQIGEAIRVGLAAVSARAESGFLVTIADMDVEATLVAMLLYGSHLAMRGRAEDAADVLGMDPDDTVGAIPMLEGHGVVLAASASPMIN